VSNLEIREQVTARLLQALENDTLPWRRPWSPGRQGGGRHRNFLSQRCYTGVNPALLELHAQEYGFSGTARRRLPPRPIATGMTDTLEAEPHAPNCTTGRRGRSR
jgi:hypothetical protein